jgi:hypothetical protein
MAPPIGIVARVAPAILSSIVLAGVAFAASLTFATASLGAATAATPRCTTGGLSVIQNLSGTTVVSVTVANLPAACGGAVLQATVNNGTTVGSGSSTVAAGGGSLTITLGLAPTVTVSELIDLVLIGP